jgi:hypothetical protein
VLAGLSGNPSTPASNGSGTPARGHGGAATPGNAGKPSNHGRTAAGRAEPAPHGAFAAVSSSAGSLLSGGLGSVLALLAAVTLFTGLAVLVRRRASSR